MSKKNETSSDEIKDGLVDLYSGSEAKDWKRKSKTKLKGASGHNVKRVFENANLGVEVVVYGDEGDDFGSFNEAGKMLFFAEDLDEDGVLEYDVEAGCFVMFAAETFWNRNHYIPDNHISSFLAEHYGVDLSDFDEMSENQFLVDAPAADVIARLEAAGFRHEPQMKRAGQWDDEGDDGEAPPYSTDLGPLMTAQMVLNSLPDHYPPHTEWQFESIFYSHQVSKLVDWWPKNDDAKKCIFVFHPKDVPDFRVAVYTEDGSPYLVHSWEIRTEDGMPLEGQGGAIFGVSE